MTGYREAGLDPYRSQGMIPSKPRVMFGLRPNAAPVYDRDAVTTAEIDAKQGSEALLKAILKYYRNRGDNA